MNAVRSRTCDADGNRTAEYRSAAQANYHYLLTDQKLMAIDGAQGKAFGYDANGNTTNWNGLALAYGPDNRLAQASRNGSVVADYAYDGLGRRVQKTVGGAAIYYHYSPDGLLLAETDATGAVLNEYVYLEGQPLAVIQGNNLYYIHNNHLGAPVAVTDGAGNPVWKADYEPFGQAALDNPSITLNLRLPGQYHDAETGLHYNYFRDYDPSIGRYLESDPIGLRGGINTYAYAGNNPINWTDPLGLVYFSPTPGVPDDASGPEPLPPRTPEQLPYDPTFTSCAQYPGNTCEGKTLNDLCNLFPKDPNSNCARKCLHDLLPPGSGDDPPASWYVPGHPVCWYECGWPGGWW